MTDVWGQEVTTNKEPKNKKANPQNNDTTEKHTPTILVEGSGGKVRPMRPDAQGRPTPVSRRRK